MLDVVEQLQAISDTLPPAEQLARALDLCSQESIPDYAAFVPWLAAKVQAQRHVIPAADPLGGQQSFALRIAHEFALLQRVMKEGSKENPPESRHFLQFKLFISFFQGSKRGEALVKTVMESEELDDVQLTENLSAASPSELRRRLFAAVNRERGHDAFLILGRLNENDLHPGEYAYLRAFCHFRSAQFNEAIEYARRVQSSVPDGPRAVEIRAKSHASLGDAEGVKEAIKSLAEGAISACQLLLLAELIAYHSCDPQKAEMAVAWHPVFAGIPNISPKDPGFGEFQKFHVRLLTAFEERRGDIAEAIAAKEESDSVVTDWSAIVPTDPVLPATSIALALEPRIATKADSPPSLPALIRESLFPSIEAGDIEAFILLFQSLYRLGAYTDFMTQFNGIWSEALRDERWLDLLGLAYQVALVTQHPLATEVRSAIDAIGANEVQTNAEELARRGKIVSRLTPMGREAYRLASLAMDATAHQDVLWRDAGLLALGYFRVVEIELNERFVRPVADSIALAQLDQMTAAVPENGKKKWKRALESLRSVVASPDATLMLGPMRNMCKDFAHPHATIDAHLRAFVEAAFEARLTPEGRAAFFGPQLIETISSDRVGKYRNPPAHGRFVGMAEAKTCQGTVNYTLKLYFAWFNAYAP